MPEAEPRVHPVYRVEAVEGGPASRPAEVRALWDREGVDLGGHAQRRAFEVLLVGVHAQDGVVAECSAHLQHTPRFGMDLWYYRTFTAREHRMANVAMAMALRAIETLERRYVTGRDARGSGIAYELENPGLRGWTDAVWSPLGMAFAGVNERGDHLRVRWFEGARAPVSP